MKLPRDAQRSWNSGAASVELALLAPALILLMAATWDFGRAVQESSRLAAAARAGAQYGMQSVDAAADTAAIAQAVRDDAQDSANALTVTATRSCQCPGGGAVACDGTCGASGAAQVFVRVQVTAPFETLFPYPFVQSPLSLGGAAVMRAQ